MSSNLDYLRKFVPITVNIQGEVSFSHITKRYEGEELIEANKRAQEHGGRPSNKPYCQITLDNPRILYPETLPQEVVMIMQERFKPAKTTNVVKYYATSKSRNLPPVAYSIYAGDGLAGQGIADRNHPLEQELDTGLTVTVGARIFDTAAGVGVGIDYVLVDEPVRYYEPNNSLADVLASQGVLYVAPDSGKTQGIPAPPVTDKAVVDNNAYAYGGHTGAYPADVQTDGEMPYDPAFYYGDNTIPATAAMQDTAPQGNIGNRAGQNVGNTAVQPQGNTNRNTAGRGGYGTAAQQQNTNRNASTQSGYGAAQPQNINRNTAAQANQAGVHPMVRMTDPRQPQRRAG